MYAIIGVLMFFVYNVALFVAFETKNSGCELDAEEEVVSMFFATSIWAVLWIITLPLIIIVASSWLVSKFVSSKIRKK
jgi:hypothetical protein